MCNMVEGWRRGENWDEVLTNVVRSSANSQDLSGDGVVHDGVTAHAV